MNPDWSNLPLCDADWNAMERLDGSQRHCDRCDYTVIDFKGMSKAEITLLYATSEGRICGAFHPEHLAPVDAPGPRRRTPALVTLALGASLLAARAEGQTAPPPPREQAQLPPGAQPPDPAAHAQTSAPASAAAHDTLVIRGTVRDASGHAVPQAIVAVMPGRRAAVATDVAGNYILRVPLEPGEESLKLRALRLGYAPAATEVGALAGQVEVNLTMKEERIEMVGVSMRPLTESERRKMELRQVGYSVSRIEPQQ